MKNDPFYLLGINPAKPSLADDTYKNGAILSQFTTEMGRIQSRNVSGLTRKSQRQIGKAIRRARALRVQNAPQEKRLLHPCQHQACRLLGSSSCLAS